MTASENFRLESSLICGRWSADRSTNRTKRCQLTTLIDTPPMPNPNPKLTLTYQTRSTICHYRTCNDAGSEAHARTPATRTRATRTRKRHAATREPKVAGARVRMLQGPCLVLSLTIAWDRSRSSAPINRRHGSCCLRILDEAANVRKR